MLPALYTNNFAPPAYHVTGCSHFHNVIREQCYSSVLRGVFACSLVRVRVQEKRCSYRHTTRTIHNVSLAAARKMFSISAEMKYFTQAGIKCKLRDVGYLRKQEIDCVRLSLDFLI